MKHCVQECVCTVNAFTLEMCCCGECVLFTLAVGRWKIAIFGGRAFRLENGIKNDFATVSRASRLGSKMTKYCCRSSTTTIAKFSVAPISRCKILRLLRHAQYNLKVQGCTSMSFLNSRVEFRKTKMFSLLEVHPYSFSGKTFP